MTDSLEEFWVAVGHNPRVEPRLRGFPEVGSAYRLTQELIGRVQEKRGGGTLFWMGLLSADYRELLTMRHVVDIAEGAQVRTLKFAISFTMERPAVVANFGFWSTVAGGELLVVCPLDEGPIPVESGAVVTGTCTLTL